MLHPQTELKFVSQEIGHGIFATADIPKGTITWVKDQLDRVFTQAEVNQLTPANFENLMKYTYRNKSGDYFFCWDLARFVNHNHNPNTMLTPLGFEIALRNIKEGEEITNDYGTLNIIESFQCASGPQEDRHFVHPDDLLRFHKEWDSLILAALPFIKSHPQALEKMLTVEQIQQINSVLENPELMPSIKENYFGGLNIL